MRSEGVPRPGREPVRSKADLHIHTRYSDGADSVEAVLAHVAQHTDLRVIAITDHDTIDGALLARRLAPDYGLEVIVGEEVSTREGHLLALFIEQPLPPGRPLIETVAAIHAQAGLCVAAHPYDFTVPSVGWRGLRRCGAGPLDGIEVFNAGLLVPYANALASRAAARLGLATVGGSDAHHLATIGSGYTLFRGQTAADLHAALRLGQTQAAGHPWGWQETLVAAGPWFMRTLAAPIGRALLQSMRRARRAARARPSPWIARAVSLEEQKR